jgi:hypothetical protein
VRVEDADVLGVEQPNGPGGVALVAGAGHLLETNGSDTLAGGFVKYAVLMRLLASPIPLSNMLPAAVISLIALCYLEEDGLMLVLALVAGIIVLGVDVKVLYDVVQDVMRRISTGAGLANQASGMEYRRTSAMFVCLSCERNSVTPLQVVSQAFAAAVGQGVGVRSADPDGRCSQRQGDDGICRIAVCVVLVSGAAYPGRVHRHATTPWRRRSMTSPSR